MSPFALSATVYSDVLIDKGDFSVEIGPGGFLNGTVGDKFLVPIGRRAFINCDLADAGGFPYNSSANPPLPVSRQWFKDGQSVDLRLFDNSNLETSLVWMRGLPMTAETMSAESQVA